MRLLLYLLLIIPFGSFAQEKPGQKKTEITLKDNSRAVIVSGQGNVVNTTQIIVNSRDHQQMVSKLKDINERIKIKIARCETYKDENARRDCRTDIIMLNKERDSLANLEEMFREDVLRLAETFNSIQLNSERLRLAKELFDKGEIREADRLLNAKEMTLEGDALLRQRERQKKQQAKTDSLLRITADEFALKAGLKLIDYSNPSRYDSAENLFSRSLKYSASFDNLMNFAKLLQEHNRTPKAVQYTEKALAIATSNFDRGLAHSILATFYFLLNKFSETDSHYQSSLKLIGELVKEDSTNNQWFLAQTLMNYGGFCWKINNQKAEQCYLQSLKIYERIAEADKTYEGAVAMNLMNLGLIYVDLDLPKAKQMFERSLALYEKLALDDKKTYEPELALAVMNFGVYYDLINNDLQAEEKLMRARQIYERLVNERPDEFEPQLAKTLLNLAFVRQHTNVGEAEQFYLQSISITKPLAQQDPLQFEPVLFDRLTAVADYYMLANDNKKAKNFYMESLSLIQQLVMEDSLRYEEKLTDVQVQLALLHAENGQTEEAENFYLRACSGYKILSSRHPDLYDEKLATTYLNLAIFYHSIQRFSDAERTYLLTIDVTRRLVDKNLKQFNYGLGMARMNLGKLYAKTENFSQSERLFLAAIDNFNSSMDKDKASYIANIKMDLASLYRDILLDYDKADSTFEDAVQNYRVIAAGHPDQEVLLAATIQDHGVFSLDRGKLEKSGKYLNDSFQMFEQLYRNNPSEFAEDYAYAFLLLGDWYEAKHEFVSAKDNYFRGLDLYSQMVDSESKTKALLAICGELRTIRDSIRVHKDWKTVTEIQNKIAMTLDSMLAPSNSSGNDASAAYASLSWCYLLTKDFKKAESSARRAIQLDLNQFWAYSYLGHSYLMRNDWTSAKKYYEQFFENADNLNEAKEMLIKDFADLAGEGVKSPHVNKVIALAK